MYKGFLMSFEGGEGCGKSTQVKLFDEYLTSQNISHVVLREPGGTDLGEKVRELLLNKSNVQICDKAELMLFLSARCQIMQEKVLPYLNQGVVVVLDRFCDSTIAYQGYARGANIKQIKKLCSYATTGIEPNLTIYLKIPTKEAFDRITCKRSLDRLESEGQDFHQRVEQGYNALEEQNKNRIKSVDATADISTIHKQIVEIFKNKYKRKQK